MSNADVFENFTHSKEFYFERNDLENITIFSLRDQDMRGSGGTANIFLVFSNDDQGVDIQINFAKINNPLRKESAYELLNELNVDYRFTKFKISEDIVSANYSFMYLDNEFTADSVMEMSLLLFESAVKVYPKFMKLIWG